MDNSRFKFRVWDKRNKKFLASLCLESYHVLECFFCDNGIDLKFRLTDKDRFELIEFTGLYDCKGKEIWEWDILSDKKGSLVVTVFEGGKFLGKYINSKKMYGIEFSSNTGFKVIGNRFENHELLEEMV